MKFYRAVRSGLYNELIGRLTQGRGIASEQKRMKACIARRIVVGLAAAKRYKAAKEAEELCRTGNFAAALLHLNIAIDLHDLPSHALKAWILIEGRECVAKDHKEAFFLAYTGTQMGCHHCKGVLALCYFGGWGCMQSNVLSLKLARESSGLGSRYGQHVLGELYFNGIGDIVPYNGQKLTLYRLAEALYRLAAAQNLDLALVRLGYMTMDGHKGIIRDFAEALRLFKLAAAQGHPRALFEVANFHVLGLGVHQNEAEAIRWYRRAQAAGYKRATNKLWWLRA
jgi:TPR repeat protein